MTACWHGKLERCDDCPKPQGYIPEGGVWTREERLSAEMADLQSEAETGEWHRAAASVAALLAALKDLSDMAEPYWNDDGKKRDDAIALIAALDK